jgi:hypothetical protein
MQQPFPGARARLVQPRCSMTASLWKLLLLPVGLGIVACGPASRPPVDTQKSLPPADPPADLSRKPADEAANAGKPEAQPTEDQGQK